MRTRIRWALRAAGDRGASAVEYGLMIAAIAALIVGIVFGFGTMLKTTFQRTTNCIAAGSDAAAPMNYPKCPKYNP